MIKLIIMLKTLHNRFSIKCIFSKKVIILFSLPLLTYLLFSSTKCAVCTFIIYLFLISTQGFVNHLNWPLSTQIPSSLGDALLTAIKGLQKTVVDTNSLVISVIKKVKIACYGLLSKWYASSVERADSDLTNASNPDSDVVSSVNCQLAETLQDSNNLNAYYTDLSIIVTVAVLAIFFVSILLNHQRGLLASIVAAPSIIFSLRYLLKLLSAFSIPTMFFIAVKCVFVFILVVLVRVTVPKLKMESLTKMGWIYSMIILFLFFLIYALGGAL